MEFVVFSGLGTVCRESEKLRKDVPTFEALGVNGHRKVDHAVPLRYCGSNTNKRTVIALERKVKATLP
jgi:hypothetical protein